MCQEFSITITKLPVLCLCRKESPYAYEVRALSLTVSGRKSSHLAVGNKFHLFRGGHPAPRGVLLSRDKVAPPRDNGGGELCDTSVAEEYAAVVQFYAGSLI